MESSNLLNEIYKSRNNHLKQLKVAGYNISGYENMTINEVYFMHMHGELNFDVTKNSNETIFIKYHLKSSLRAKNINDMTEAVWASNHFSPENSIIVLMLDTEPNSSVLDLVKQIYAEENIYIILYNINRLLFNILDHVMVPTHTVLSPEEAISFKEKFRITRNSELPTISRFDPVAMAKFMRPGEICKILRSSVNAIESEYFRLCVNL